MHYLLLECPPGCRRVRLPEEVRHRLTKVLRLQPGDQVEVLDRQGRGRGVGTLAGKAELEISQWQPLGPDPHPDLRLYLPALKGDRLEWAALRGFEMGLRSLALYRCQRAQLDPPPRLLKRLEALGEAACEQSGRCHLPEVLSHSDWQALLAGAGEEERRLLILHPGGGPWPARLEGPVGLVVGPEGGLTEEEVALAESRGALRVGLAGHVLRAETAAVVATTLGLERAGWFGLGPPG